MFSLMVARCKRSSQDNRCKVTRAPKSLLRFSSTFPQRARGVCPQAFLIKFSDIAYDNYVCLEMLRKRCIAVLDPVFFRFCRESVISAIASRSSSLLTGSYTFVSTNFRLSIFANPASKSHRFFVPKMLPMKEGTQPHPVGESKRL